MNEQNRPRCYKCSDTVHDVGGTQILDGWVCDDCAPEGASWQELPKMTVTQLRELDKPSDLIARLTGIRDIARSGLPSSGFTVEQSQRMKLDKIAGALTRVIDELKDKGEPKC